MKIFSISHTKWERANFYHMPWKIRENAAQQSFSTNSSIPCFGLSQMIQISAKIMWWTHRTNIGLLSLQMKPKHRVHIKYLGWSLAIVTLCLNSSSYTQHGGLYQVSREDSVDLDRETGCWKNLRPVTGVYTNPHQQVNPGLAVIKFLQPHHPKHLTA